MSLTWMLIRGSGLIAYLMLAGSTIWGLLISAKVLGRSVSVKTITLIHEALAIGALLATAVHLVGLFVDEFVEFDLAAILIPGASLWEPLAVSFGVMAFYGMVVVIASFYVRQRIGQTAWRMIHYLSFGVFASSAAHGLMAGTDSGNPLVIGLYGSTIAGVVMLTIFRGFLAKSAPEKPTARVPREARPKPAASAARARVDSAEAPESSLTEDAVLAGQSSGSPKP